MTNLVKPSFAEIKLGGFTLQNPHCSINFENNETIIVEKPWGRDDVRLRFSANDNEFISDLNSILLNPRYDAIFHNDTHQIEFIFGFTKNDESNLILNRNFKFYFEGDEYQCGYYEPSQRLMRLVNNCEMGLLSDSTEESVPQLRMFKDFQRMDNLHDGFRKYFEKRAPRNFFVKSKKSFEKINIENLARHLNFLMCYYDRQSPCVVIKDSPNEGKSKAQSSIRMIEGYFPQELSLSQSIDDIVLRLTDAARKNPPRIAFLYYYQVFEYTGYYYIDEKARLALRKALRDPALICGGEERVSELFTIFSDMTHSDEVKMRKVIEEYCDPKIIWQEVQNDIDFFSLPHTFDGGFTSQPLIASNTTEESWNSMWMPKTFDLLTKIRNVLVHAREKRESKVILPTQMNNLILKRYLPLIERIAQELALTA